MLESAEYFGTGVKISRDNIYIDAISELRENGLVPVTPAMVMDKRVEVAKSKDKKLISILWGRGYWSCFGVSFLGEEGIIYIHPNLELSLTNLRTNPELRTTREENYLKPGEIYLDVKDIDTKLRTYNAEECIVNRDLDEEQVRNHKI